MQGKCSSRGGSVLFDVSGLKRKVATGVALGLAGMLNAAQFNPGDNMYLRFIVDNTAIDPQTWTAIGPITLGEATPESLANSYAMNTFGFKDHGELDFEPAPEPTSMALLVLGIAAMGMRRGKTDSKKGC